MDLLKRAGTPGGISSRQSVLSVSSFYRREAVVSDIQSRLEKAGMPWLGTIEEDWLDDRRPENPKIRQLLHEALVALRREDSDLRGLFENSPCSYADVSHGLAYWLFETTIVYVIFKSWILIADVVWEAGYPANVDMRPRPPEKNPGNHATCDLRIVGSEENRPDLWFEAKWWWNMTRERLNELNNDVGRLRRQCAEREDNDRGFLISFWPSWTEDHWATDKDALKGTQGNADIGDLIYFGLFPTHHTEADKQDPRGYFAMAVFEVQ
jgi:hypothetical protein